MRSRKAALAGAGSSGSLVAALACLFLVVSAAIVFKGWPGGPGERVDTQAIGGSVPAGAGGATSSGETAAAGGGGAGASDTGVAAAQGVLGASESSTGSSSSRAPTATGVTPATDRSGSRAGVGERPQGGGPAAGGPTVAETVSGIVERAARDFGSINADLPGTGDGQGAGGGGPAGGGPVGDNGAPQVDEGDVDDSVEDADDRARDVVDDVSDAVGDDKDRGKGKD
jgi:hypothetical protein